MAILALVILMSIVTIANELLDHILYMMQSSSGSNGSSGDSGGGSGGGPGGNGPSAVSIGGNGDPNKDKDNQNNKFIYNDPMGDARRADRQAMKKALRARKRAEMFQVLNFYDTRQEPSVNVGPSNPFSKK